MYQNQNNISKTIKTNYYGLKNANNNAVGNTYKLNRVIERIIIKIPSTFKQIKKLYIHNRLELKQYNLKYINRRFKFLINRQINTISKLEEKISPTTKEIRRLYEGFIGERERIRDGESRQQIVPKPNYRTSQPTTVRAAISLINEKTSQPRPQSEYSTFVAPERRQERYNVFKIRSQI